MRPVFRPRNEDRGPGTIRTSSTGVFRPRARALRRGDVGYTLVALVIGMAVLTILLAAVGPVIATVMKRDREEELLFRGRQYALGIQLFQRHFGRYPNTLKEMYENRPRTIRKLWKDPMCRCDNWHLLIAGTPDGLPFRAGPGQQPGTGLPPPRPTPTPGIVDVHSGSAGKALDGTLYKDW